MNQEAQETKETPTKKPIPALILYGAAVTILLFSAFTYLTLPDTHGCTITRADGDKIDGNCTELVAIFKVQGWTNIDDATELMNSGATVKTIYIQNQSACTPCTTTTTIHKAYPLCPQCPPCPECPIYLECATVPAYGFSQHQLQQLRNIQPNNGVTHYQGGFFNCKKRVFEILKVKRK